MSAGRRVLSILAIVISVVCCAPVALCSGFFSLAGGVTFADSMSTWEGSDTVLLAFFLGVLIISAAVGLIFLIVGIWSLVKKPSDSGV